MNRKVPFLRWVSLFAGLGLLIPAGLLIRLLVFSLPFGNWEVALWPSSIMLMALDAPGTPTSTVVFIYFIAFLENALLYAVIGALTWLLVCLVQRRRNFRSSARSKSQRTDY